MERLHPGVYVEEVPTGARPIEGVSTSTAAFLGKAERGPLDRARLVTSFIEFQNRYGGFLGSFYLAHAALQFFDNGGRRLWVARVARADTASAGVVIGDRKAQPEATLTVSATSPGAWGNELEVVVSDATLDPADKFKLSISYRGSVAEVFDELSVDPEAPSFADTVVNARSQLVRVAVEPSGAPEAGTSTSGPGALPQLQDKRRRLRVSLNGDGPQTISLADPVTTGTEVAAAIQNAVRALMPLRSSTPASAFTAFTAEFSNGVYVLTSGEPGPRSSVQVTNDPDASTNAAKSLKLGVGNGGTESTGWGPLRPAPGTYLVGDGKAGGTTKEVTLGRDGPAPDDDPTTDEESKTTPQDEDYRRALALLDAVPDVNLVAVPGVGTPGVVDAGTTYCQNRTDCFYLADMPRTALTTEDATETVDGLPKSPYGAVFFPWLTMVDPTGVSPEPVLVPPSGFVAGVYARIDARRGVWKAPAGTEANLGGAVGLAARLGDAEQDVLNPRGVNVIRFFPSSGIVLWGSRTLATQARPEWRYVPVRRLAIFLEESIYNGIQWAVFEPNDEDLWASLRLNIGAFMLTLFRSGAFQGDTPAKAFFVKCDSQTNPQDQIDAGIVTVLVGFAPLRPAEFVVIRISQKTAEATG